MQIQMSDHSEEPKSFSGKHKCVSRASRYQNESVFCFENFPRRNIGQSKGEGAVNGAGGLVERFSTGGGGATDLALP